MSKRIYNYIQIKNISFLFVYIFFILLLFQDIKLPKIAAGGSIEFLQVYGAVVFLLVFYFLQFRTLNNELKIQYNKEKFYKCLSFYMPFILFFVFEILFSILYNGFTPSIKLLLKRVFDAFILILPVLYITSEKQKNQIVTCLLIVSVVLSFFTIARGMGLVELNFVRDADLSRNISSESILGIFNIRNMGLYNAYNSGAMVFGISVIFLIQRIRKRKNIFLNFLILSLILLAVIPTNSRNVIFTVSIIFVLLFWKIERRSPINNIIIVSAVLVLFSVVFLVFFSTQNKLSSFPLINNIITFRSGGSDIDPRIAQFAQSVIDIYNTPFTGVGPGNEVIETRTRFGETHRYVVHNVFLQAILRAGIGGWLFLILLLKRMMILFKDMREEKIPKGIFISYVAWFFPSLFAGPLGAGKPVYLILFGFIASMYINNPTTEKSFQPNYQANRFKPIMI